MEFNSKNAIVGAILGGLIGYFSGLGGLVGLLAVGILVYLERLKEKVNEKIIETAGEKIAEYSTRIEHLRLILSILQKALDKIKQENRENISLRDVDITPEQRRAAETLKIIRIDDTYTEEGLHQLINNINEEIDRLNNMLEIERKKQRSALGIVNGD